MKNFFKAIKWRSKPKSPWEWYYGEVKTCQFLLDVSNPLPRGSSHRKKIWRKSLNNKDMGKSLFLWLKLGLKLALKPKIQKCCHFYCMQPRPIIFLHKLDTYERYLKHKKKFTFFQKSLLFSKIFENRSIAKTKSCKVIFFKFSKRNSIYTI